MPKTHSDRILKQFEEAQEANPNDPRINAFRQEHENNIYQFVDECDRRIRASQRKLEKTPEENRKTVDLMREIGEIELSIQGGTEEIEALGEAGKVEESMEKLAAVDALKQLKTDKEKELQILNENAGASGHQKLRVCEICGAMLSVLDSDKRLADHFGGKMHLGFRAPQDHGRVGRAADAGPRAGWSTTRPPPSGGAAPPPRPGGIHPGRFRQAAPTLRRLVPWPGRLDPHTPTHHPACLLQMSSLRRHGDKGKREAGELVEDERRERDRDRDRKTTTAATGTGMTTATATVSEEGTATAMTGAATRTGMVTATGTTSTATATVRGAGMTTGTGATATVRGVTGTSTSQWRVVPVSGLADNGVAMTGDGRTGRGRRPSVVSCSSV
jgi:hypothetical protein